MVAPAPPSMSAASSAKSGDVHSSTSFMGGDFYFGGSGSGSVNGGFNLGALVKQYWPVAAVAGVVWYLKFRKK